MQHPHDSGTKQCLNIFESLGRNCDTDSMHERLCKDMHMHMYMYMCMYMYMYMYVVIKPYSSQQTMPYGFSMATRENLAKTGLGAKTRQWSRE